MERELAAWILGHGFDLISAVGIVAGLLFTAASLRADTRSRRVSNLITLTQQHRDLWEEQMKSPLLRRVTDPLADLESAPVTAEESRFMTLLILHLHCWFRAVEAREVKGAEGLSKDMRRFFALPVPRQVWKEKRPLSRGRPGIS